MASMACVLQQHGLNNITNISKSTFPQRDGRPNLKPTKLKLVCRVRNEDDEQVQSQKGISRRSVVDGLIVTSVAVGSALAFGSSSFADDDPLAPKGKTSWPELVGEKRDVTVATIKKENPYVQPVILSDRYLADLKYSPSRVQVFVNEKNVVSSVPRVG